eukprot:TRINITY_DN4835_c1_g1_i5.p1 TRINITY_DN4835_c1_g1~~TRINITY_DN4835_c1_g1_i5.p1  ORF type:complete len:202 (-),score=58.01 TRINITY_DN4835_c1_g1_i5:42-647(-)
MSQPFLDAVLKRRTIYALSPELPAGLTESKIEEIVKFAITNVPSSFNSQSTRAVVLFRKEHDKVWNFTMEVLRGPADKFEHTEQRINGFKNGYGTVLFFEDVTAVDDLQKKFPSYQDKFPDWSQHTNAMNQFVIWTALEAEGLGCSLQHYNPLIDQQIKNEFKLPGTWSLVSQMPFGKPTAAPGEKTFQPIDDRVKVFGKQ